jgi:hypothetical protein
MTFKLNKENVSLTSNIDFDLQKTQQKINRGIISPAFISEEHNLEDEWSNIFAKLENINKYGS